MGLNNRNLLFYKSGDSKSRKVSGGLLPSQGGAGKSVPCLCLLAFGGLLTIFGLPWPVTSASLWVCSQTVCSLTGTSEPTLLQDNFIFRNYLCNHPISISAHMLRYWGLGFQLGGDRVCYQLHVCGPPRPKCVCWIPNPNVMVSVVGPLEGH